MRSTKRGPFLDSALAMAVAEIRSTRRSISVWVLVTLGFAVNCLSELGGGWITTFPIVTSPTHSERSSEPSELSI